MYAMAKILGFVRGPAILAGFLGLFLYLQDLMLHLSGLVFGAVGYPIWLARGAVHQLFGWEYFSASVAGLGLAFLLVLCFKKVEKEISRLLLSWQ